MFAVRKPRKQVLFMQHKCRCPKRLIGNGRAPVTHCESGQPLCGFATETEIAASR